jgi:hypothetical protein
MAATLLIAPIAVLGTKPARGAAIASGLVLQRRFEQAAEDGEVPLWVRIGMHWGGPRLAVKT